MCSTVLLLHKKGHICNSLHNVYIKVRNIREKTKEKGSEGLSHIKKHFLNVSPAELVFGITVFNH